MRISIQSKRLSDDSQVWNVALRDDDDGDQVFDFHAVSAKAAEEFAVALASAIRDLTFDECVVSW